MNQKSPFLITCLAMMLTVLAVEAAVVHGIDILEYGIYKGDVVGRIEDKGVAGGTRDSVENFKLILQTKKVPAKLGTRVGFRYAVRGSPEGAVVMLKMVGKYPAPGLMDPKTKQTRRKDEYTLPVPLGESFTSFSFDRQWEVVPGD